MFVVFFYLMVNGGYTSRLVYFISIDSMINKSIDTYTCILILFLFFINTITNIAIILPILLFVYLECIDDTLYFTWNDK